MRAEAQAGGTGRLTKAQAGAEAHTHTHTHTHTQGKQRRSTEVCRSRAPCDLSSGFRMVADNPSSGGQPGPDLDLPPAV